MPKVLLFKMRGAAIEPAVNTSYVPLTGGVKRPRRLGYAFNVSCRKRPGTVNGALLDGVPALREPFGRAIDT
jgi:hypothetical protein